MNILKSARFWVGISFILLILMLRYSGVTDHLTIEKLQDKRAALELLVQSNYLFSVTAFICSYITVVVLALPLAALMTIAGGFLFGVLPATLYTNIGATVGAVLFFLLVRHSLGTVLQKQYADKLAGLNGQMERYGTSYLIAIRLFALVPFFVGNLLIGLTHVPLSTFIWTTSLGVLPGSLVYAYAGKQLANIKQLTDVFSVKILLAFGLLALLALVPIFIQRYRRGQL